MSMEESHTGRGIRIKHVVSNEEIELFAGFDEAGTHRLDLIIRGDRQSAHVYLTKEETAYFLAWMARWHEQGEVSA